VAARGLTTAAARGTAPVSIVAWIRSPICSTGGVIAAVIAPQQQRRTALLAGGALNTWPDLEVIRSPCSAIGSRSSPRIVGHAHHPESNTA